MTVIRLNVTYEIDGEVSPAEVIKATHDALYQIRDEVGFDFVDEEAFVEAIVIKQTEEA